MILTIICALIMEEISVKTSRLVDKKTVVTFWADNHIFV